MPRAMGAFRGPTMNMMPMAPMPILPPQMIRTPQHFNNFNPYQQVTHITPSVPANFAFQPTSGNTNQAQQQAEAVAKPTEAVNRASQETNGRLPMRAKFEEWLDVLEALKQKQASDEEYAEAFQEFVNVEPKHNMYLTDSDESSSNIQAASTKKLNNNDNKKSNEDYISAMTVQTVERASDTDDTPEAALAAFLKAEPRSKLPQTFDQSPASAEMETVQEEEGDEYYDDVDDDDQQLDEEEEMAKVHNQILAEVHKPAALSQPTQMQRKKEVLVPPPQLWMSARSSNIRKNGVSETRQEFDMKRTDDQESEQSNQRLRVNVEPQSRQMQFESFKNSQPTFDDEEEALDHIIKAMARQPQKFEGESPEEFHKVKAIQPLRPIASRDTIPLIDEDDQVPKLSMMSAATQHHRHHQNHHHQNHHEAKENGYYLAKRIY